MSLPCTRASRDARRARSMSVFENTCEDISTTSGAMRSRYGLVSPRPVPFSRSPERSCDMPALGSRYSRSRAFAPFAPRGGTDGSAFSSRPLCLPCTCLLTSLATVGSRYGLSSLCPAPSFRRCPCALCPFDRLSGGGGTSCTPLPPPLPLSRPLPPPPLAWDPSPHLRPPRPLHRDRLLALGAEGAVAQHAARLGWG